MNSQNIANHNYPNSIMDFLDLEEEDITSLIHTYDNKRDPTERINFGLTATRHLKGLLRWVQDQRRCNIPIESTNVNLFTIT